MASDIQVSNMGKHCVEQWEKIGILANTPVERKEKVAKILDYALEFLINLIDINATTTITRQSDGMTLTSKDFERIEIIFIPIILRIVNVVDISKEDVRKIYGHIQFDFFDYMKDVDKNSTTDWELHYVEMYADKAIHQFQEK